MLTIYKASAGSGKTFQLALFYLKIVLGVKERPESGWRLNRALLTDAPSRTHRNILAITFTNKATEEMKTRIVSSLDALSKAEETDDHVYIEPLMKELGCTFEELRTAAQHAMMSILLDFTFFNVSTIDSFFQTVLRTFARELGIQGDYNIEINAGEAIRTALNMLLDSLENRYLVETNDRAKRIQEWLDQRASGASGKYNPFRRKSKDFSNLVNEIKKIFKEDFKPLQVELFGYLDDLTKLDEFKERLERYIEQVIPPSVTAAGNEADGALKLTGQYDVTGKNTKKFIQKVIDCQIDFSNPSQPLARVLGNVKDGGEYKLNKGQQPNDAYLSAMDAFFDKMQHIYSNYRTAKLLLKKIPHLEFICLVIKYLEEVREEENMLILDDTSTYIWRIIGGSEIPFIYEHLGTHLKHFLIDEFQDTSRLQWKNLYPLVANSHANGDDSLIIGDVKQAIYRFRNSDAKILGNDLENRDFPDAESRETRGLTREDNCNRRTAHGIVKFNNTILPRFAELALHEEKPDGYRASQIRQQCWNKKSHLASHIALYPCDYKSLEKGEELVYEPGGNLLEQPVIPDEKTKIEVLINNIRRQVKEGYRYNDIAVLFRTGKNVKEAVKAMLAAGIPIQSSESLFLKNAPSIRLLVSLLNMMVNVGRPFSRAEKGEEEDDAEKERRGMSQMLFESRYNFFLYHGGRDGGPLSPPEAINKALDLDADTKIEAEEEKKQLARNYEIFTAPRSLEEVMRSILNLHPANLTAIIEAVLSSGLIPETTIQKEKDYIAAFTDLAVEYCELHEGDLKGFMDWWKQHSDKATVTPPPDSNAVKVLSIHRAKGLEFNCVHLIDFDWKLVDERETAWLDIREGGGMDVLEGLRTMGGADIPRETVPPLMCFDIKKSEMDYPFSPFRSFLEGQQRLMRTDSLNLAYVGLTRAETSLSVYFKTDEDKEEDTVGALLARVIDEVVNHPEEDEDCMVIPPSAYNGETKALWLDIDATRDLTDKERAEPEKRAKKRKEQQKKDLEEAEKLNGVYRSVFRADVAAIVNVDSIETLYHASEDDDSDSDEETRQELMSMGEAEANIERRKRQKLEQTQRGLDLHEILSYIKHVEGGGDIDAAIGEAVEKARQSEGFNESAIGEYTKIVRSMIEKAECRRWFAAENVVETELSYHQPWREGDRNDPYRLGHSRRIDRMVELADGSVEIVDYKFAKKEKSHEKQLREYMQAVGAIFPGRTVRGYLWYQDLDEIDEVTV